MKLLCRVALVAMVVAGLAAAGTARAGDADVEGVRNAADRFYAALNVMFTGELAPMIEVWSHADDVTYMGPLGGFQTGWAEVLAIWQAQAAMKLGGVIEPKDMRVTAGTDIAVTSNYEVGENVVDGKPQTVTIRATNIFRKEDGTWKMIGHHTDLLPFLVK